MGARGCRQDTQPAHYPYIKAWVKGPLHPAHLVILLLFKARIIDLLPIPQGDRK